MKILKKLFILIVLFSVCVAGRGNAFDVSNSNEDIPLRLKAGMITEAEFPDKIANVTKSVSSEILQIETLGNRMFLLPRENIDSQIYVITQDSISYCLHLIMDETQAPVRIKIEKPRESIKEGHGKDAANITELMKALLTGRQPPSSVSSKLHGSEIFNNGKLRIVIDEAYDFAGNVKAFGLTFENLDHKPTVVPIEHIELPGLLAISIDSQILETRQHNNSKKEDSAYKTKAYMIVEGLEQ